MSPYSLAVLLGVIEGLTEFLPVSSTAHLRIAEAVLGVDMANGYWKMFTIVIQLGAILALPLYFWKRILHFFSNFPTGAEGNKTIYDHPVSLTFIAFFVTAIPAYLLTKVIGKNLENLWVMAGSLIVGGIVMWIVDAIYEHKREVWVRIGHDTETMEHMSIAQSIWIGACQILSAVFPGTSRSMATIAAGQTVGMSRTAALEFSFFLSIPTMVAATGYDLFKSIRHGEAGSAIGAAPAGAQGWVLLGIGFVVSFLIAYGVVAWFMTWVRSRGFVPFAIYRLIAGLAVLAWILRGR